MFTNNNKKHYLRLKTCCILSPRLSPAPSSFPAAPDISIHRHINFKYLLV